MSSAERNWSNGSNFCLQYYMPFIRLSTIFRNLVSTSNPAHLQAKLNEMYNFIERKLAAATHQQESVQQLALLRTQLLNIRTINCPSIILATTLLHENFHSIFILAIFLKVGFIYMFLFGFNKFSSFLICSFDLCLISFDFSLIWFYLIFLLFYITHFNFFIFNLFYLHFIYLLCIYTNIYMQLDFLQKN